MNNSIFWFSRLGVGETTWDNALLSMTSLWWPPSMPFCFLISPPSLIWYKLCERTLTRATLAFPVIAVFPCLTMSQNHRQLPGPKPFKAPHRSSLVPTCAASTHVIPNNLTAWYHFFPCPDKGWFLVLYPFLGQYFVFSTPSWTLQTFKAGILL